MRTTRLFDGFQHPCLGEFQHEQEIPMLVTGLRRCSVPILTENSGFSSCFFDFPIDGNLL